MFIFNKTFLIHIISIIQDTRFAFSKQLDRIVYNLNLDLTIKWDVLSFDYMK